MAYEKDPTEKKDYAVDWTAHLLVDGVDVGQLVTTSTWSIAPAGLTAGTPAAAPNTGKVTSTRLTGGTAGTEYRVTNHVVTSAGQEFERSFYVNVTDL